MTLADGDAFVVGDVFSFQQAERIKDNWRAAAAPSNPQPGSLWSKSTNDKLYHRGASAYIELYSGVTEMYKWKKGADKASAAALDISALDGNYFDVTGVTAITSITVSGRTGTVILLHFDAILTLTHHATNLVLPNGENITTAAGDEAIFIEYDTGKWRCISYSPPIAEADVKVIILKVLAKGVTLTTEDDVMRFTIPIELNGMDLISVGAHVYVASTSGVVTIDIYNYTDSVDMLSTAITIDQDEKDSKDAATPAVIDTGNDDVAEGDEIGIDITGSGTGAEELEVRLGFI